MPDTGSPKITQLLLLLLDRCPFPDGVH